MSAEACTFKRERSSQWEDGIAVGSEIGNYDIEVIVDINYKAVPAPIYTYNLQQEKGSFQFLAGN